MGALMPFDPLLMQTPIEGSFEVRDVVVTRPWYEVALPPTVTMQPRCAVDVVPMRTEQMPFTPIFAVPPATTSSRSTPTAWELASCSGPASQ